MNDSPTQSESQAGVGVDVDMCVVGGAGHVGLPLALSFAEKGLKVLIYDINEDTLAVIADGRMPFAEEGGEQLLARALKNGRLFFSSDPNDIPPKGTIVITIGTPIDEFLNPVHKVVRECFDILMPYLADDRLVILRSTVYPGTLEWLEGYLKEAGRSPLLAFCPERVLQGKAIKELAELPQIISGSTPEATKAARAFFDPVVPEMVELTPTEAAFAKLFDNAYRYIHFAISNQFYMITNSAGVDYYRILEGVSHNYPRAQDIPTAGFAAGPCLFKDTLQLAAFACNQFSLGHEAMLVNEGLVLYIVERLREKHDLANMTIGLLGMAFKADSDDIRASLSYKVKKALSMHTKAVVATDPYVTEDDSLLPLEEVVKQSDLMILCVPHAAYGNLDPQGKPVVDIWNFLDAGSSIL
jgi:UDP-N-acetyl-D-mannosaminuronic acid dehydrogenase